MSDSSPAPRPAAPMPRESPCRSAAGLLRRWAIASVLSTLPLAVAPAWADTGTSLPRLAVPEHGAYAGAYIDFGDYEDEVTAEKIAHFSTEVGKHPAIVAFSNYWGRGHFPTAQAQVVAASGAVPLIFWNPWESQEDKRTSRFDLARIENGELDDYIDAWGRDARAYGQPLLVSWGLEMNGNWFPWSGSFHGGGEAVPSANPPLYLGPETFKRAYRHVVDRVRATGASNVSWVFHANNSTDPDEPWNHMASYYPGSDYVDWLGMSAYGTQYPTEDWITVDQGIVAYYRELAALDPTKPIVLAEWGVAEFPHLGDKGAWIAEALHTMEKRLPRLKAAVFWDERWQNGDGSYSNLRASSSAGALAAYRKGISRPFWIATPEVDSRTAGTPP